MKNFFRFFISKTLLFNLLAMAVVTALIIYITVISLDNYTNHGEEFSLTDFSGMTIQEVDQLCQQKHLRYEIIDSVFSRRKKKGTVIEQEPLPGFKVKENRRVFLIMNATQPEMIKMPFVKGVDFKQAWMDLESYGLIIDKITYVNDPAQHIVTEQKHNGQVIFAGERIEKGSGIELLLGRGNEDEAFERTRIPRLREANLKAVKKKLLKSYLNIGHVAFDRTIQTYEDSLRAFVWKQRPSSHALNRVSYGTNINVWLTLDSTKIETGVPEPEFIDTLNLNTLTDSVITQQPSTNINL